MKLVNYWDKYTEMHGQQNVKISSTVRSVALQFRFKNLKLLGSKLIGSSVPTESHYNQTNGLLKEHGSWPRFVLTPWLFHVKAGKVNCTLHWKYWSIRSEF